MSTDAPTTPKTSAGTGKTLEAAIQDAIAKAHNPHTADELITWTLSKVSGKSGGFGNLRVTTVEIEYTAS